MSDIVKLQDRLGYHFKDVSLFRQALTHRSFGKTNYERLEFVGDGILDYVVALNLYNGYPNLSEGELSKMRAALVNQDTLVEIAEEINLGDSLFLGDGEEKSGGRRRASILADSLEAVFAAVSFDSSFNEARQVIENLYSKRLDYADTLIAKDSKSLLQEYLQGQKISVPNYDVIEAIGPDHDSVFHVECIVPELNINVRAKGKSKKEASQLAAEKALGQIKKRNLRDE